MKKRLEANITGRVQLVMFRDFAKRKAKKLGLNGLVKNLNDGSVSVIAEGEEEVLNEYIKLLNRGPILAKVKNIRIVWEEFSGQYNDFNIIY